MGVNRKMENILTDNEETVMYVVMVEGREVTTRFTTPQMAEMQIQNLSEDMKTKAAVVPVTESGAQLLLG